MPFLSIHNRPWQPRVWPAQKLPCQWRDWLLEQGSLTERLKQTWPNQIVLNLLDQQEAMPAPSEACALSLTSGEKVLVRQVLLCSTRRPRIFARTLVPQKTLEKNPTLLDLGQRPLGDLLFTAPNCTRGQIEIDALKAAQFNPYLPEAYSNETAWARRSVFFLNGSPLLVCEVFLPEKSS